MRLPCKLEVRHLRVSGVSARLRRATTGTRMPLPAATARGVFPTDLRALSPERRKETEHAQPAKDGGGNQPGAGLRNLQVSPAMAHPISPPEKKTKKRQGKKDNTAGKNGFAPGRTRSEIGRSHGSGLDP